MTIRSSRRIEQVQQPLIPIIGDWIAQTPGTISLAQGIVHYEPPVGVAEAVAKRAGDSAVNRYGNVSGTTQLTTRISEKLSDENSIAAERQVVVCTAGSNMGFLNAVLAVADVGEEIILLSPYYFNHHMAIEIAGCKAVPVPTDTEYMLDFGAISSAITDKTRAIVTVSPNNPTGAVYSREALTRVNRLCQQRGLYHISDEAYEYFVYGNASHFSPASLPDSQHHTISLYTLSKAYAMAGWRVGYMVIPPQLESAVRKIQDTNLVCPPVICQIAACAALDAGQRWCADRISSLGVVRERVLDQLDSLGGRCRLADSSGAFYLLLQLDTDQDDMSLVHALIRDHGIATLPGSTFGIASGCSLRISYGSLLAENVVDRIGRLTRGLRQLL